MEPSYFVINSSVVNVYSEPNFRSAVISQALLGESCALLEDDGNWVRVRQWDDYEGWINRFHGVVSDDEYGPVMTVLDMHGAVTAMDDDNVIREMVFGDKIVVNSIQRESRVTLPDGTKGRTTVELGHFTAKATRENILLWARRFTGIPYLWGGTSIKGFDCSGFVQTVFRIVGIHLPRDAYQQAVNEKLYPTTLAEAQPGDLLFFGSDNHIAHVAIATGGKGIIHAQGWVKEDTLDEAQSDVNEELRKLLISVMTIQQLIES